MPSSALVARQWSSSLVTMHTAELRRCMSFDPVTCLHRRARFLQAMWTSHQPWELCHLYERWTKMAPAGAQIISALLIEDMLVIALPDIVSSSYALPWDRLLAKSFSETAARVHGLGYRYSLPQQTRTWSPQSSATSCQLRRHPCEPFRRCPSSCNSPAHHNLNRVAGRLSWKTIGRSEISDPGATSTAAKGYLRYDIKSRGSGSY